MMPGGRHTRLTRQMQDRIVAALVTGMTEEAACRLVRLNPGTYYRWKRRGEIADTHWPKLTDEQQRIEARYREFREAVLRAWDESHFSLAGSLHSAAVPHEETETVTTTETVADPKNPAAQIVTKTITVERKRRVWEWRAALAILERRHPNDWAKTDRHEITGKDGGPIDTVARFELKDGEVEQLEEALARVQGGPTPRPPDEEPAE